MLQAPQTHHAMILHWGLRKFDGVVNAIAIQSNEKLIPTPSPRFTLLGSWKCSTEKKLSPKSQERNFKTPGRPLFQYAVNVSGLIL